MAKSTFGLALTLLILYSAPSHSQQLKVESGVVNPYFKEKRGIQAEESKQEEVEKGLNHLNRLRELVGLPPFSLNLYLSKAALNHARYMAVNGVVGHYEEEGSPGFTGVDPSERAVSAGYPSRFVGENLSYGQEDVVSSIDELFSAIYHRLGFLDFNYDEVGIGIHENFYVYDMGNREISDYCENPKGEVGGYYYYGICKDESVKVPVSLLESLFEIEPDYVLWPPPEFSDTLPAFFEEFPDPLPDYGVSGYPISVSFNPKTSSEVKLESFRLYKVKEGLEEEVENLRVLTHETDPNGYLSPLQFALFPLERLDWGGTYTAEAVISTDSSEMLLRWNFKTRSLKHPYYVVDTESATLTVKSGVTYDFYFKPLSPVDVIENFSYSGFWEKAEGGYIDGNTIWFRVSGKVGSEIVLKVKEIDRTREVRIVISDEDRAVYPKAPGKGEGFTLKKGWNLKGTSLKLPVNNFNLPEISIIWKYRGGDWYAWSPKREIENLITEYGIKTFSIIEGNEGFWVKAEKEVEINLEGGGS